MTDVASGSLNAGRAYVDVLPNMRGFAGEVNRGLQGMSQTLTRTGRRLTRSLTLPIVGLGAGILAVAGNFESSMNQVRAVTGATGDELDQLTDLAKELGRTTQFSASEAADAMYFLASAGFDTNEVMEALPGTLELAAAAGMELGTAADIASNILSGYGMEAAELGRVNDTLVATFQATNTNVEQLGAAMSFVAPVAAGAGLDFEEVAAALGLMGNAGIQGSRAGTALRGAITRLLNPTNEATEIMERLGLNVLDAEGNMRPLDEIIRQLEDSGASTADMMALFGDRAGPALVALVEQGSGALTDLSGDLRDAGGVAGEVADVQMEGLQGSIKELKSALEGVAIAIADAGLIDWAAGLAGNLAELVRSLADVNPQMLKLGTVLLGSLAVAGPLMWGLGAALGALGLLLSPAGLIIGGLVGLGAVFVNLVGEGDTFMERVGSIVASLQDRFGPAVAGAVDFLRGLRSFIRDRLIPAFADAAEGASLHFEGMGDTVDETVGRIVSLFDDTLIPAMKRSSSSWGEDTSAMASAAGHLFNFMSRVAADWLDRHLWVMGRAATGLQLLVEEFQLFSGHVSRVWNSVSAGAVRAWDGIQRAFDSGVRTVRGWINNLIDFVNPILDFVGLGRIGRLAPTGINPAGVAAQLPGRHKGGPVGDGAARLGPARMEVAA